MSKLTTLSFVMTYVVANSGSDVFEVDIPPFGFGFGFSHGDGAICCSRGDGGDYRTRFKYGHSEALRNE